MNRLDQALTNIAASDPKWLLERKAAIERRQREHNERMRAAIPLLPKTADSAGSLKPQK